jgi:hypothetical protein
VSTKNFGKMHETPGGMQRIKEFYLKKKKTML